jgi:hypothetical protein
MARMLILAQARTLASAETGKVQVRGVFSQKKKLLTFLQSQELELDKMLLFDDVAGKDREFKYTTLCNIVSANGRAVIKDAAGRKQYLIVEAAVNAPRGWDTDENGNPVANPTKGDDDEASAG